MNVRAGIVHTAVTLSVLLAGCDSGEPVDLPRVALAVAPECDIQRQCIAQDASRRADVQFGRAPRALQPFPVHLKLAAPEPARSVTVTFTMKGMDMGLNRYQLRGGAAGAWEGAVTLPICVTGRSDWIAGFEVTFDDTLVVFDVPFVLDK